MKRYKYIEVNEFCMSHGVEVQFMSQLHEFGLIELIHEKNIQYFSSTELSKAEKIVRLYSELDINLEGIEVIQGLLERMEKMQNEIVSLKNKLDFYE